MQPENDDRQPPDPGTGAVPKKPYRSPSARLLGDLRALTRGGQGSLNDARNRHNWKPY
jgi:hypothetical protein